MSEHVTSVAASELAVQGILLQLVVVIVGARLVAGIGKRFGQAVVVGEMIAGILLGPSLFGALAPDAFAYVFTASTGPVFSGLAQVGLVLLMFQIGLEFELAAAAAARRAVLLVSVLALVIPFLIGGITSTYFYAALAEPRPEEMSFTLIFAVSMSITALPVLGRISAETGLDRTRAGAIAICAAAIGDVVGWLLLGAVTLLISGQFSLAWVGVRLAGLCAIGALAVYVLRPRLHRYFDRHLAAHGRLEHGGISLVLVLLFACALVTSRFGLHALMGGFILGIALHQHERFVAEWQARIGPLVTALFLPIFFAQTGLRTDVGSIGSGAELLQCGLICAIAFACKFGGGYLGARLAGESPRTASVLGTCMNTRGLMELIVLNVGFELGVLPRTLFTQLVYMAVLTTVIATPLIRRYLRTEPGVTA
jgi:Kef-type K+ transport system membrane component KefB